MSNLERKLITPQSLVIEKTALELATAYHEAGRSSGLISKHKNAKAFAKANVEKFIPKAIEILMQILSNPATPQEQRDLIYDAFMERSNDPDLSNSGIGAFKNDTPFLIDGKTMYDKTTLDNAFDKVMQQDRINKEKDNIKPKSVIQLN